MKQVHTNMRMTFEIVTPQDAEKLLATLPDYQRGRQERWLRALARDMVAGDFVDQHQAIAIDENGNLLDGQQRYAAAVLAGVPFRTWVCRGVPADAFRYVDSGARRRVAVPPRYAAVIRALAMLPDNQAAVPTHHEIEQALVEHAGAIESVCEQLSAISPDTSVRAPVLAAFVRALPHIEPGDFSHAIALVKNGADGAPQAGDGSLIVLRSYILMKCRITRDGNGRGDRPALVYAKTERALRAFAEGRDIQRLARGDMSEVFPTVTKEPK